MKIIQLIIAYMAICVAVANALEPVRVSFNYTGGGSPVVAVELYNYGSSSSLYSQSMGALSANGSGIITFIVGQGQVNWTNLDPANITGKWVMNVSLDGTLSYQYRLDQLITVQSAFGEVVDEDDIALDNGKILVGNGSNQAVAQTLSGDATMSNAGVLTVDGLQGRSVVSTAPTDGQVLTWDNANSYWEPATPAGGGSVNTNASLTGNGTVGTPLAINLGNSNTWTANQTFASTFLITSNARIALVNSDNNPRDIRFQEPSGTGSQYIGLRAPSVTNNGNYVFPAVVGTVGQVLTIATSNNTDSATTAWTSSSGYTFSKIIKSSLETKTTNVLADDNTLTISWGASAGTYRVQLYFNFVDGGDGINARLERLGAGSPTYEFFTTFPNRKTNNTYQLTGFAGTYGFASEGIIVVPSTVTGLKLQWSKNTDATTDTQILDGILFYEKIE